MNEFYNILKHIFIWILILIINIIIFNYGIKNESNNYISTVPGVILNKTHIKSGSESDIDEWHMLIKPDNINYKIFDVNVSYTTYCSYKEGYRIAFKHLSKNKVIKNYHSNFIDNILPTISIFISVVLCIGLFVYLIIIFDILSENYREIKTYIKIKFIINF